MILDTQLMVLLAAGLTSRRIIRTHKRLTEFSEEDFDLLMTLLGPDPKLVLLPNTVSEAANLLRHHDNPEKNEIMRIFAELVARNRETYVTSKRVVLRPEYRRLGVTDCAILEGCASHSEILTADAGLYLAAAHLGLDVTNFNHKREEFGLA